MQLRPFLLEILSHLLPRHLHDARILHRRRHLHLLRKLAMHRILHQLPQHPPQRLAAPSLGDHAFALHHPPKGGDGADLLADVLLDLFVEVGGGDGGRGVGRGGEGYEGEGEVAFEGVGDADDAALGNGRVGGDGLFDGAWGLVY